VSTSGVGRGLGQGRQNVAEGGRPIVYRTGVMKGPLANTQKKTLRNNSEPGCLYWLKNENTSKNAKKQPTESQKNTKYQNIS